MAKTIYFTICAANYLGYARTLATSLRQAGVDIEFKVFLADRCAREVIDAVPDLQIISVESLEITELQEMAFRYGVVEFCTALKPFAFEYVFDSLGADFAVYLDPDIFVLRPLDHVTAAFGNGAQCILIPHITAPLDGGKIPDTPTILRTGVYNLGFAAFANRAEARSFIGWWGRQLRHDCRIDFERGIFVDQRYCDLAPCFIAAAAILRQPGYNVAYWNLPHRHVEKTGASYTVNSEPLYFVHFSGVELAHPDIFSKYQDRFSRDNIGALRPLYDHYLAVLAASNVTAIGSLTVLPYAFATLNNGRKIVNPYRWAFEQYRKEACSPNPFDLDDAFFNATASDIPRFGPLGVSRLYAAVWRERRDLQPIFHIETRIGQLLFLDWARTAFASEYGIPEELLLASSLSGPASIEVTSSHGALDGAEIAIEVLVGALLSLSRNIKNVLRLLFKGRRRAASYWRGKIGEALTARRDQLRRM